MREAYAVLVEHDQLHIGVTLIIRNDGWLAAGREFSQPWCRCCTSQAKTAVLVEQDSPYG